MPSDSVSLDALASQLGDGQDGESDGEHGSRKSPTGPRLQMANVKMLASLFILFVVVVSDVFVNNVISGFGEKAVRCRNPTSWGVVLQGILLVIMFAAAAHLTETGVL